VGQIVANIIVGLVGMAWSIVTIFVVPILVYEGLGPVDAIKKSIEVIKKTWGESLIKSIGLGLVQFLTFVVIAIVSAGIAYALSFALNEIGIAVGIGIGVLLLFLSGLVFSVANTIFNTALYIYATKNSVVAGFDEDLMKTALKPKN
jgi:membrane-anchored glycerophosphoryl diester phosphodiesterase (GDPDase)